MLGQVRRAQAEAERAAAVSLRSVTDNPVYVLPDARPPARGGDLDRRLPQRPRARPRWTAIGSVWADLCQLAQRLTDKLLQHPATAALLARDEWTMKPLHMVQTWWAEEARALAGPTLLSLGGFGQNDVPSMGFLAWRRADAIGRCLDAALAILAALGAQALHAADRPRRPRSPRSSMRSGRCSRRSRPCGPSAPTATRSQAPSRSACSAGPVAAADIARS